MDELEENVKEIVISFYGRDDAYETVSFLHFCQDLADKCYPDGYHYENRSDRRLKNKY